MALLHDRSGDGGDEPIACVGVVEEGSTLGLMLGIPLEHVYYRRVGPSDFSEIFPSLNVVTFVSSPESNL